MDQDTTTPRFKCTLSEYSSGLRKPKVNTSGVLSTCAHSLCVCFVISGYGSGCRCACRCRVGAETHCGPDVGSSIWAFVEVFPWEGFCERPLHVCLCSECAAPMYVCELCMPSSVGSFSQCRFVVQLPVNLCVLPALAFSSGCV